MGLLGSSTDDSIDQAMGYYKQGAQASQAELQKQQAAGNEAIQTGVTTANTYTNPYTTAGGSAVNTYANALGLGGSSGQQDASDIFKASTGYQWANDQATQSIQRDLAARGLSGSGAEQKELADYITGAASQEYNNWLGNLQGLSGMGQASSEASAGREADAGSLIANLGYGYGSTLADVYTNLATSAANAELAKALASSSDTSSMLGTLGSIGGAIVGGIYGGPVGAKAGSTVGGKVGGAVGG